MSPVIDMGVGGTLDGASEVAEWDVVAGVELEPPGTAEEESPAPGLTVAEASGVVRSLLAPSPVEGVLDPGVPGPAGVEDLIGEAGPVGVLAPAKFSGGGGGQFCGADGGGGGHTGPKSLSYNFKYKIDNCQLVSDNTCSVTYKEDNFQSVHQEVEVVGMKQVLSWKNQFQGKTRQGWNCRQPLLLLPHQSEMN